MNGVVCRSTLTLLIVSDAEGELLALHKGYGLRALYECVVAGIRLQCVRPAMKWGPSSLESRSTGARNVKCFHIMDAQTCNTTQSGVLTSVIPYLR